MDNDSIRIDEAEASYLASAVREQIKNTKWDPLDEKDWVTLTSLKDILGRLYRFLDAEFDRKQGA